MITEDYCSEELTKLLLEKGCQLEKVRRRDGRPVYFTLPTDHPNWPDCDVYYIPTHAQVMKWLREEHNIIIVIEPHSYNHMEEKTSSYDFSIWCEDNYEHPFTTNYPTYEETADAAIKYSLKIWKGRKH